MAMVPEKAGELSLLGSGNTSPLGATVFDGGVNFSVFARDCTGIELLLFDAVDDQLPSRVIVLDPRKNRTYHYWHVFVPGIGPGQLYGYRVSGPFIPQRGFRFDPEKLLLDPYGRAVVVPKGYDRGAACLPGDNVGKAMKSVVADPRGYDWEGDLPLKRPFSRTVIYEMHVAGFTKHPSSGVAPEKRGTYAGLMEKIPYLQELGVTAVELLPVFQFDPNDAPLGLRNFWGYSPVSFFAPHAGYSSDPNPLGALNEFRTMVKALHRAGIEVILDVVFNHTSEGDHKGPTFCYRGFANDVYYTLSPDGNYMDYSGCGNTFNANHHVVRRMIIDSLLYWVREMHVDGFRFDLASILSRDLEGHPLKNPPIIWDIESEPALAGIKLIAEAWDAGGLYQVGSFIGDSWTEWNGEFRDDVRSFFKGDNGSVSRFASRLLASPDIYGHQEREPEQSINFVTCHDGFTLNDLVSYNRKHNEANGEDNRDGATFNVSWNCGVEGESPDPAVEALRNRQVKNFLAATLLALGTPMILMGDEVRRTQKGNNNAYCQDNEIGWFDWRLLERHADVHRFVQHLIHARLMHGTSMEDLGLTLNQLLHQARLEWHGVRLGSPDWSHESHSIALTAWSGTRNVVFHYMVNAYWKPLNFRLPSPKKLPGGVWHRFIDTSLVSPDDILPFQEAPEVPDKGYLVKERSLVVLVAVAKEP
ncbi:glycogen debranching protein GlgX [Geomesophilobacter sediminis]|uniref:Glycogen debranching protein GlgX n=1 Tax=Geomesophilobacter sediminis TaxID=2798584 RepID=A0A8J7LZ27_9BACT|nr:glycogen debranching protein GlgX [Geomesophilobacter sediminis]MBJ6725992.1 glycogen debranching protein GlgX [Geomesophilobacter sediminis]